VPDTGYVGSIGVIMLHMSQAERDAKSGYKYTAIYAGAHKNELNPHFDLSDAARARLQSMVDASYQIFVDHIASARGVDAAAVRATEAGILEARPALEAKLVDGISTFAETLAALDRRLAGSTTVVPGAGTAHQPAKETAMSEPNKPAATDAAKPAEAQHQPAQVDAAKVSADAAKAERARVSGIFALAEAKDRPTLAQYLATETETSVEEAKKLLAKSPLETAKAGEFVSAMRAAGNPPVAAGGADEDDPQSMAKRIAAHVVSQPTTN
jgi:ClpP class serine protease